MKIINKQILADAQGSRVTKIEVISPAIALKAEPGQFVALIVSEEGERIPLTVVEKDIKKGTITLIFQEVGLTTKLLGKVKAGDSLFALVGPLGHPTEIKKYGRVILVGGGVGIAEIYPIAKAMREAGNHVTTILGARTKELLILENELKASSDEFYVATDDGSYGRKGFNADILEELLKKDKCEILRHLVRLRSPQVAPQDEPLEQKNSLRAHLVYAVGPIPMMQKVASVTKPSNTKTLVSLNAIMVDATGMCGCCRVSVGGEMKFSCVDGPDFDAHLVDWDELIKRNRLYSEKEKHICNLLIK